MGPRQCNGRRKERGKPALRRGGEEGCTPRTGAGKEEKGRSRTGVTMEGRKEGAPRC